MNRAMGLAACAAVALSSLCAGACGGGSKKELRAPDGGAPSASASAPESSTPATTSAPPAATDARDQAITRACTNKCERECEAKEHDRRDFFEQKQALIAASPFEVKVDRVWLKGSCHKGDVPEKRDDADGITTLVEGKITYKGDEPLFWADLNGWAYLDVGDGRVASVTALEKTYSGWGGPKLVTRIVRRVRGSDPWRKGQAREFHWESQAMSEAFCEVKPKGAAALLELRTLGVASTVHTYPIARVPILWDEVVGMAMREHVTLHRNEGALDESVDASFSRLEKVLVTGAAGKSEWVARTSVVQSAFFTRHEAAPLPATVESPLWSVKVTHVAGAKDAGDYAPVGEDQFVVVVDVELQSKASDGKPTKAKAFGFQLETTPGSFQSPLAKAQGQLDGSAEIAPGEKVTGKLVFARQRFERPFRLQIKTPDRATLLADVFTYDLGAEASK